MRIYLLIFCFLSASCATKKPSEYQLHSSVKTPNIWEVNSTWNLVITDSNHALTKSIVLKFTSEKADSCSAGDFKKIEIISEYPRRSEIFMGKPAYFIRGGSIIIDFSANLCDAGNELQGYFSDLGVQGVVSGIKDNYFYGSPIAL